MKRIVAITSMVLAFAFTQNATAQETDVAKNANAKFPIGARIGSGFSQFGQPGNVITATAGGFVRYDVLPFLQAEAGLSFDMFGGGRADLVRDLSLLSGEPTFFNGSNDNLAVLEYLNRQVLFYATKAHLSARLGLPEFKDSAITPKFIVGGSAAYIFSAMENHDSYFIFNGEARNRVILSNQWENVGKDYDQFDFAVHVGVALDFKMSNNQVFSLEVIYEKGLNDLNNIVIGQPENINELSVQRLGINFAYTIF